MLTYASTRSLSAVNCAVAAANSNEAPVRLVSIDDAFAAGRYEVTRKEYAAFIADTGNSSEGCMVYDGRWQFSENMSWRRPGFDQDDNHPVTCISWEDARVYTQWLSRKTSQTYRLLSASEWEYIARDGGRAEEVGRTPPEAACTAGNVADLDAAGQYPGWQVVNCSDNYVHTAPVGSYTANALGVFDLTGNVFEWVGDCWNDDYKAAPTDGSAWNGGDCRRRVLRGGSWFSRPQYLRAAFRNRFDADLRSSSFGFRVARELKP